MDNRLPESDTYETTVQGAQMDTTLTKVKVMASIYVKQSGALQENLNPAGFRPLSEYFLLEIMSQVELAW